MLKNLLLVALRNLKKDKWYSLLNIVGLTIGITFSLLLIFYIKDELGYDRYNEHADRIYRVNSFIKEPDKPEMRWTGTQFVLGPALKKDYPEVEESVRFVASDKALYKNGDIRIYEDKIYYSDSNVFKVFTYKFLEGSPATALVEPKSMVLTQSVAEKYFGRGQKALGKSLQNDKGDVFKITGVVQDIPKNSHLIFNALISVATLPKDFGNNWGSFFMFTYVLLKPNVNPTVLDTKLLPMYKKYMAPIFAQYNIKIHYGLQLVTSIHLHSDFSGEPEETGSMSYIYIFGAVALFMLVIACINYMNLTTARSARRAKEIGIRKVTGSTKSQLVTQFLVESVLVSLFALLLSIGAIAALLPAFNMLSGKFITFGSLLQPGTALIMLGVVIFVGFAGGSYPAFYLSKFNPVTVLKGSLSKGSSNVTLRRVLVVVQFSISMIMLICTWVVYNQLTYLRKVDLGFDKQQVLSVTANSNSDIRSKIQAFKEDIVKNPQVIAVSTAQSVPGGGMNFNLFSVQSKNGYVDKGVNCYGVDEDYFKTLGMKIVKGRSFVGLQDTAHGIIVNENMVKYFSWDEPIGKRVKYPGDTSGNYLEVVGVVKDFNQKSLYNPIEPLILFYRPYNNGFQLKLNANNINSTIANVESTWKKIFPELPFSYTFLDKDYDSQYAADQKRGKIFTAFSILTIAVTCLGLLGLIAFTTQQRQKEISLRKIMGAGIMQLVPLIIRNFMYLVGISCFIAFPVAYWFMHKWLGLFSYNTGLGVMPFILAALSVLLITMLTVIFHTLKAALANPAKSLRTE
ncbi:MAG TPA: ABC transporter permease [Chitinophagaceae bacterium]|nr:ABC transporter permease [Chitinophagaceae bacterium]